LSIDQEPHVFDLLGRERDCGRPAQVAWKFPHAFERRLDVYFRSWR
jgi:hypothetical protein